MPTKNCDSCRKSTDIPTRQTLRRRALRNATLTLIVFAIIQAGWAVGDFEVGNRAQAQLFDALDAHPPRWNLGDNDCSARVISHGHLAEGGIDNRACESIVFLAGHGTRTLLTYPIEPTRPLDHLNASLAVKSAKAGARIGFRVRFPFIRDQETRKSVAVIVYGAAYDSAGEFKTIGVGLIQRELRVKTIAIRKQYGIDADVSEPYVDAIIVNAYCGPGTTSICLDQLSVDGMIPIGDADDAARSPSDRGQPNDGSRTQAAHSGSANSPAGGSAESGERMRAFKADRVTRILQHNGEPLPWVRSLGFDAVLLSSPPTAEILREAIRARMLIYAPPPSAPDPKLEPLLEPIVGWYIGSDVALDSRRVEQTRLTSIRLRNWPSRWQRPVIAAPVEDFRRYAPFVDAMICDAAIRGRGLTADEEIAELTAAQKYTGDAVEFAVGVSSMPPDALVAQTQAIAAAIGAPGPLSIRWHSMWTQVFRALETAPDAILYRSRRALSSGAAIDSNRSMALSYINRTTAMVDPWVSVSRTGVPSRVSGARYRAGRISFDGTDLLFVTSTQSRGTQVLAGDGDTIEIALSPDESARTYWRMSHFTAERIMPIVDGNGARLEIVSPDVVEIIVSSQSPALGGQLGSVAARYAKQATLDRWQLTRDRVNEVSESWETALSMRVTEQTRPSEMIRVAQQTLAQAEPLYRAGDWESSLRMATRADAWGIRAEWQLADAIMPDWPAPTSAPPIDCGSALTQIIWTPMTRDQDWSRNLLTTGSLDTPDLLTDGRWVFGRRLAGVAESVVAHTGRGAFSGGGALSARVIALDGAESVNALPGGYAGTAIQIRSPSIHVAKGTTYRIDAMVKTLGFGGTHQGLLAYDTVGGPELGTLIRGRSTWTPVRIFRHSVEGGEVSAVFELLGSGEATIDEVSIRVWEPSVINSTQFRPIAGDIRISPIDPSATGGAQLAPAGTAVNNATRVTGRPNPGAAKETR